MEEAIQRLEVIKTNALIQKANDASKYWKEEIDGTIESVDMAIKALQFAKHFDLLKEYQSLQEVVRCKDCRHCSEYYDRDGYPYWECDEWDSGTDADGFCYYGEKSNGE